MNFFGFGRRIRHPFFPHLPAVPAASARGRAQALAGTFAELAGAAARGVTAASVVYVTIAGAEPLSDGERDELWRLYEVPVYAMIARDGKVEAWECEAQRGMHAADGGTGVACPCGRPGARETARRAQAHAAD